MANEPNTRLTIWMTPELMQRLQAERDRLSTEFGAKLSLNAAAQHFLHKGLGEKQGA